MEQFWGVRLKKIMIFWKITILRATLPPTSPSILVDLLYVHIVFDEDGHHMVRPLPCRPHERWSPVNIGFIRNSGSRQENLHSFLIVKEIIVKNYFF